MATPSGYQQAILHLLGVHTGGKFLVRCIDKWYIDAVADLFPTSPYLQAHNTPGKKDYWVIKSAKVDYRQDLAKVTDWPGFCRGAIELQGVVDSWKHRNRKRVPIITPRLRIYGEPMLLNAISQHLPAAPKKMQSVNTATGSTYSMYYQSPAEVADILNYIYGVPANAPLWERWWIILYAPKMMTISSTSATRWLRGEGCNG